MTNRLEASVYNTFVHGEPFRHTRGAIGGTAEDLYASNARPERDHIVDPQYVFGNLDNVDRVIERARRL